MKNMLDKKKVLLVFVLALLLVLSSTTSADIVYPFEIITGNGDYYEGDELSLSLEVENLDSTVSFTFENDSSVYSSISRIYFEYTTMLVFQNLIL